MRKKTIALIDQNEEYAGRLADYLNSDKCFPYKVSGFNDRDKLKEYASKYELKLIVCGITECESEGIAPTVYLVDDEHDEGSDGIYRYKSGDYIAKRIRTLIGTESASETEGVDDKCKLIAVYSPVGRCLKTSFSLVLGQMISRKERALYLNFETYSGFGDVMLRGSKGDLADLIFYINNRPEEFREVFKEMTENVGGLDYINPAYSFGDVLECDESKWIEFIKTIRDMNEYDYIILDLSDYMNGLFPILKMCNLIYTIKVNDGMAMAKISQYESLLKELDYEDIISKTKTIGFPRFRQLPDLPADLIRSEMAEYVREYTREEFGW